MLRSLEGLSSEEAWFQLGDSLKIPRPDGTKPTRPDIEPGLAQQYHKALMGLTGPIRDMLRERRGLTDETLKAFKLGWDGDRITIPIYDEFNVLVNFRRYKWNSTEDQWKVLNYVDEYENAYGEVRIFGLDRVLDDSVDYVVWSEGEMDRIIAEQYGFPTACATSGAGTWKPEWTRLFRNKKRVYIAQDNDEAGRNATQKLCEKLYRVVDVYTINWPEDFPGTTLYNGTAYGTYNDPGWPSGGSYPPAGRMFYSFGNDQISQENGDQWYYTVIVGHGDGTISIYVNGERILNVPFEKISHLEFYVGAKVFNALVNEVSAGPFMQVTEVSLWRGDLSYNARMNVPLKTQPIYKKENGIYVPNEMY